MKSTGQLLDTTVKPKFKRDCVHFNDNDISVEHDFDRLTRNHLFHFLIIPHIKVSYTV